MQNGSEMIAGLIHNGRYINEQIGFTFDVPHDSEDFMTAEIGNWSSGNPRVDYTIDFFYTPDKSIKQNVFSLIVLNGMIIKQDRDDEMWYISAFEGKTYAHVTAGEPSEELLQPQHRAKLEIVQKMIYEDLPLALQTKKQIK